MVYRHLLGTGSALFLRNLRAKRLPYRSAVVGFRHFSRSGAFLPGDASNPAQTEDATQDVQQEPGGPSSRPLPSGMVVPSIGEMSRTQIDAVLDQLEGRTAVAQDRAEWKIHSLGEKLQKTAVGSVTRSPSFSLLGAEGLRLEIFLLGDSLENLGYVSFYLSAPEGTDVCYTLWLGEYTSRPLQHRFEKSDDGWNECWGCPQMCSLQDLRMQVQTNESGEASLHCGIEVHKVNVERHTVFLATE